MSGELNSKAPRWFMIVAVVLLVWNLLGVMAYIMQVMMSPGNTGGITPGATSIV